MYAALEKALRENKYVFCATTNAERAESVDDLLEERGLKRGKDYKVLYPWAAGNGKYQFVRLTFQEGE